MAAETINGRRLGFERLALQVHICFLRALATLTPVAWRTSGNQVTPRVWPTPVPWNDMIQRQVTHLPAAILARKIVPAQDLSFGQRNTRARAPDHVAEADHRRNLKFGRTAANHAAAIENRFRPTGEYQRQCTFGVANV